MTLITKYTLWRLGIFEDFYFFVASLTFEAGGTERLITSKNCEILYHAVAITAFIFAVITDAEPVVEEEKVCIRVKEDVALVASDTIYVPMVTIYICISPKPFY